MKLDCLPGAHVAVRVDGQDLQEYSSDVVEELMGDDQVCYVEAKPGAAFSIVFNAGSDFPYHHDNIRISVHIDGQHITTNTAVKGYFLINPTWTCSSRTTTVGSKTVVQSLNFGSMETTEDCDSDLMLETFKDLGEIVVRIRRVGWEPLTQAELQHEAELFYEATARQTNEQQFAPAPMIDHASSLPDAVPEKALKGRAISSRLVYIVPTITKKVCTSHTADVTDSLHEISSFDTATAAPKEPRTHRTTFPSGKRPIATYRFRYRTHQDLLISWIIPRGPIPPVSDQCQLLPVAKRGIKREHSPEEQTKVLDLIV